MSAAPQLTTSARLLTRLEVRDFRNLAALRWEPLAGPQLLVGANGAGKTSLLEAIYLAATSRSFRTGNLAEAIRRGATAFEVRAEVDGEARHSLACGHGPTGRWRRLDDKEATLADHLAALPVVTWTSRQAEVLRGGPLERRRFLDAAAVASRPASLVDLARYRQALAHKRALLESGADGHSIEPWNALLAVSGAAVVRRRAELIAALGEAVAALRAEHLPELPPIELRYRPAPAAALDGSAALENALAAALPEERRRRSPRLGPHRDELEVRWGDGPVRAVASAGERKAAGLLLVAAQGRVCVRAGRPPLYLLDDLDAELDPQRVTSLWRLFAGSGQAIAASSRPEAWVGCGEVPRWAIAGGVLAA